MKKAEVHPLDIPDFLKVANRDKIGKRKKTSKEIKSLEVKAPSIRDQRLEALDPEFREKVEKEIKVGRLPASVLDDPSALSLYERITMERQAKKTESFAAFKASLPPKEEKAPKPSFGVFVIIKTAKPNPRKEGTGAWKRYGAMLEFWKKNKTATVAEIMTATGYRQDDFNWDLGRKTIETDIVQQITGKKTK